LSIQKLALGYMSLGGCDSILLYFSINITSGSGAMPCGPSLACGGYLCDLLQPITTVAYPYDEI